MDAFAENDNNEKALTRIAKEYLHTLITLNIAMQIAKAITNMLLNYYGYNHCPWTTQVI